MKQGPYLVLVMIGLIWGSTWAVAREALERMPVMLLMGTRYLLAGALLTGFYRCRGRGIPSAATLWRLLPGSLLMFTLNGSLSYWSILYIPSHVAAIIGSLAPLFIFCLGITSRSGNVKLPVAMLVCVAGVVVLAGQHLMQAHAPGFWGYVLSLAAVLSWSLGVMVMRRIRVETGVYDGLGWQMLLSSACLLLAAWATGEFNRLPEPDMALLGALLYLAVPGSVIAFVAVGYVYKHLPAGIASSYEYLSILVAAGMGYFYLDEQVTVYTVIGGAIILTGVWLVRKYDRPEVKNIGGYK